MILLLGGTSETAKVAEALAKAGQRVLVSTATDIPLNVGSHANISRRSGRLDAVGFGKLVRRMKVAAIVDVSHPYAAELRATAEQVARGAGIPYWSYVRPGSAAAGLPAVATGAKAGAGIKIVKSHAEAAQVACAAGRTVLLTVGSRNVAAYAEEARRRQATLIARVLPRADSLMACRNAGIPRKHIVTGRGPFSVQDNRTLIRRFSTEVVVTKDSGKAGGFPAKWDAAQEEGCLLVVVGRSAQRKGRVFGDTDALVQAVLAGGLTCKNFPPAVDNPGSRAPR